MRTRALLPLLCLLLAVAATGEEEGIRLLSPPETGDGIAAKYPGDRGIARDPKVILTEDFECDGLAKRWDSVKRMPGPLSIVEGENAHSGERAVRIDFTPGENTGGHLYKMLEEGRDRLHLRFYVKFSKDHGYVHHFVHLCGYRPGTPWPQGGAGSRPAGDERFSTGIDLYGDWGRTPPPGRWGFYSYWCEMKGSRDGKFWGNEPPGGKRIPAKRDAWTSVEMMVKLNEVGQADGEQAFWIDGKLAGRWGGYRWRKHEELKINAVWLLYYVTADAIRRSRGEPKPQHVLFDDVVVATDYIGPQAPPKRVR